MKMQGRYLLLEHEKFLILLARKAYYEANNSYVNNWYNYSNSAYDCFICNKKFSWIYKNEHGFKHIEENEKLLPFL